MPHTVLVTEPTLAEAGTAVLQKAGCRILYLPRENAAEAQLQVLRSEPVDAIIARGLPITAEAIRACRSLRVVSRHGVGYNHVDVAAATAAGVAVLIATGANAQSVAELALGMMVAVARGFAKHDATIRAGGWSATSPSIQLHGRALGIVGVGNVGSKVAALGLVFGMAVHAYDPYADPAAIPPGVTMHPALATLLAAVDVLSLHCPLTPETQGMIGAAELALVRPGAILVNTSRGPVLDEAALITALTSGHLVGAGLDTFEQEPLPAGQPIAALPNVILTPHIGGSTAASLAAVSEMAATNALRVLDGESVLPGVCVNPTVLSRP